MTTTIKMAREITGALKFTAPDAEAAARLVYAKGNRGRDIHLKIARPLHDAFSEQFQSEVRKARFTRAGLGYEEAASFVMAQRPELAYAIGLDILDHGARGLDVELDVEEEQRS